MANKAAFYGAMNLNEEKGYSKNSGMDNCSRKTWNGNLKRRTKFWILRTSHKNTIYFVYNNFDARL